MDFNMALLEEVFGVNSRPILSYVERPEVDERFLEALVSDKEIIVYGSSKQGKTALVSKYLPYESNILVSLTPKATVLDIYQIILRQAGIQLLSNTIEKKSDEATVGISAKVRAMIPLFGGADAGTSGSIKGGSGTDKHLEEIPINLELPQHVADLLRKVRCEKWVIMENFHYLNDDVQKQFAFDLRAFQELGVRFVILGVWREKNRMVQFNGDLLDRIIEVPVEPWKTEDFQRVVDKGAKELKIEIEQQLVLRAIAASFSSIGVFQELIKGLCAESGVTSTPAVTAILDDPDALSMTIASKANDYAARHQRALEAIAAGHSSGGAKGDLTPLYLPYYLVRTILELGFDGVKDGMHRTDLHSHIRSIHHRGADVRPGDISNLLSGLANLQATKAISPPIIDYDSQNRVLQVVDSTFYFFIKNANLPEILSEIPNPLDA
jgi:hypothetical protein